MRDEGRRGRAGNRRGNRKKLIRVLRWTKQWDGVALHYTRELRAGRDVPDGFTECPSISPDEVFYWSAFTELSRDRPTGMAAGEIPFSSIDRFATRHGISDIDEFERLRGIIRALDAVALERETPLDAPTDVSDE
jgi:hypothetical protein